MLHFSFDFIYNVFELDDFDGKLFQVLSNYYEISIIKMDCFYLFYF